MNIHIRPGAPGDAAACGQICFEAFAQSAGRHGFPSPSPSPERAAERMKGEISTPGFHCLVAEIDGRIVGSNFLDERADVAFLGPLTVNPNASAQGVGRALMEPMLARAKARKSPAVHLVQDTYNCASLALYAGLGFEVRAPLALMQGAPIGETLPGFDVRPCTTGDLDACNALSAGMLGYDRRDELQAQAAAGGALVVERNGRMTGFASGIGFLGHAAAETENDLKALIGAATEFSGPGFLVPTQHGELLRWCLDRGLRVVSPATLMTRGRYREPHAAWLASIR